MKLLVIISWALLALSLPFAGAAADRVVPQSVPTIALTSPPANALIAGDLTPTILLSADASSADYPIAHVVFYMCETRAGTCYSSSEIVADIASPPYEYQWTPARFPSQTVLNRTYQTWAVAVNSVGQAQTSSFVPFTVIQPPPPPSVSLVVPGQESGYVSPAAPVLLATAVAGDTLPPSTIARVDFLDGSTAIGSVAASNSVPTGYAFTWQNAPYGIHLVSARAIDSLGYSTTSRQVTVYIVDPDPPPQVTLTSPLTGQIFVPSNNVPLAATAMSSLGAIQRVEFVTSDLLIGTSFSPPYALSWSNPPAGTFAVVAKAYDDIGIAAASAAAYIQVLPSARSPVVVMTAPAPGAGFASGAPLVLAATALAPDGSIGRVDFFAGSTLLGSTATSPYAITWANPASGPQALVAKAVDLQGNVGTSAAVSIQGVNNSPPTVTLTSPVTGSQFSAPATIALAATANDSDGSVAKVEFYAGTTKVASATAAPFNASWTNVAAGSYALTAIATDNLGATTTSVAVPIAVNALAPSVSLSTPPSGATYAPGQSIVLSASASAPQRNIGRVEFYSDGVLISSAQVTGGPSAINVNSTWTSAASGPHVLAAKVFTTDGASAMSPSVTITVSDLAVNLTEPFLGEIYQAPGQIRITANPSETGGSVAQVNFYGDGVLLGSRTSAPYSFLWSPVATGAHTVSVQVRDSAGLTASSGTVAVAVVTAPTLQVDAGIDGSLVADDNASISGSVQAPPNAAVTVNGRLVTLDSSGHFFIDGLLLEPGANTITLGLTIQQGTPATKTITLNRTSSKPFQVSIDRQEGIAPFDAVLTITNRGGTAFQRIEIDGNGDGMPEVTLTSLPNNTKDVAFHINTPGLYVLSVKVFDASNTVIYSANRRVFAWDPNSFAWRTLGVYTGMLDRLRTGDIDAALTAVTSTSVDRYREIFTTLAGDLATIVDQLGTIKNVIVSEELMQIMVVRPGTGTAQSFTINMLRGEDGIWRIEGM
ncbi:MAG: Ig-like domain-containing protein [Casimicrobiaceae bacterium]